MERLSGSSAMKYLQVCGKNRPQNLSTGENLVTSLAYLSVEQSYMGEDVVERA